MQTILDLFKINGAAPSSPSPLRGADADRAGEPFDDALDEAERPAREHAMRRKDRADTRSAEEAAGSLSAAAEPRIDRSVSRPADRSIRPDDLNSRGEDRPERPPASSGDATATRPREPDFRSPVGGESSAGESQRAVERLAPRSTAAPATNKDATGFGPPGAQPKDMLAPRPGPGPAPAASEVGAHRAADQALTKPAGEQAAVAQAAVRPALPGEPALEPQVRTPQGENGPEGPAPSSPHADGETLGDDGDQDAPRGEARTESAATALDLDGLEDASDEPAEFEIPPIRATKASPSVATPTVSTATSNGTTEAPGIVSTSNGAGNPVATPAAPRLESLVEQLRMNLAPGLSRISFIVDPPELGRVTVRLMMRRGRLFGELSADNEDVARTLERGLDSLKNTLRDSGINVENLRVQQENVQSDRDFAERRPGSDAEGRDRSDRRADRESVRGESARSKRTTLDATDSGRVNLVA